MNKKLEKATVAMEDFVLLLFRWIHSVSVVACCVGLLLFVGWMILEEIR